MRGVIDKYIYEDSDHHYLYFGIVVAPKFSTKADLEAKSSPHPIRLSYENTIVKDVGELVMGKLVITEGINSVIKRMGMEIGERIQRIKEEEKSERKKLEQRLEQLERENEELRSEIAEFRQLRLEIDELRRLLVNK